MKVCLVGLESRKLGKKFYKISTNNKLHPTYVKRVVILDLTY